MNIHLLAIAQSAIIRKQGLDALLNDFIIIVNELDQNGLKLKISNQERIIHGFLAFCLGDNLALHWIGGFFENMSKAHRFCRHCEITRDQRSDGNLTDHDLRLIQRHMESLELIESVDSTNSIFGIKMRSPLLKIKNFNICNSLLQDPMHTLIEGVCVFELSIILTHIINAKGKNINYVNEKILNFPYGILDKDKKPTSKIDIEHIRLEKFNLTGSQILTLILNFPMIFGDDFEVDSSRFVDSQWENFIILHKIVNIVFTFQYTTDTVNELDKLIIKYLVNLKKNNIDFNYKPKHHFMTHFPSQMKNFGPLRHHHVFRFESKNGQMKEVKLKNFINVSYSLSMRHQYWLAGKQAEAKMKNSISYLGNETKISEKVKKDSHVYRLLNPQSHLYLCKYAKLDGFFFTKNLYLLTNDFETNMKIIYQIDEIYNSDGQIIFYLNKCKIEKINLIKNSVDVNMMNDFIFLNIQDLKFKNPHCGFRSKKF
jgi:hypothetical protein